MTARERLIKALAPFEFGVAAVDAAGLEVIDREELARLRRAAERIGFAHAALKERA